MKKLICKGICKKSEIDLMLIFKMEDFYRIEFPQDGFQSACERPKLKSVMAEVLCDHIIPVPMDPEATEWLKKNDPRLQGKFNTKGTKTGRESVSKPTTEELQQEPPKPEMQFRVYSIKADKPMPIRDADGHGVRERGCQRYATRSAATAAGCLQWCNTHGHWGPYRLEESRDGGTTWTPVPPIGKQETDYGPKLKPGDRVLVDRERNKIVTCKEFSTPSNGGIAEYWRTEEGNGGAICVLPKNKVNTLRRWVDKSGKGYEGQDDAWDDGRGDPEKHPMWSKNPIAYLDSISANVAPHKVFEADFTKDYKMIGEEREIKDVDDIQTDEARDAVKHKSVFKGIFAR